MSKLPNGWAQTSLDELVSLRTGPFGSALHQSDYVENGVPIINPMHIVSGCIRPSRDMTVSAAMASSLGKFRLQREDVILGRRGEMGRCAVVREREEGWLCGTGSLIVRAHREALNADYLQCFLSHDAVVTYLLSASVGSTMANLNQQHLLATSALLPPLAEQTRIVEKLEELLSGLDAGVAELKAAQRKLARYRQSLLKAAVQGDLTADWRERNAPTETGAQLLGRILAERRTRWEARQLAKFEQQGKAPPKDWQKKYPEPVRPDTTELPALPQGWVWATVDQFAQVGTGVTPLRSRGSYFNGGAIPWVTSGALNSEVVVSASEFVTELALKECRLEIFPAGSLLIAMYGEGKTRGKCAELAIPATINQAIAAVVLEPAALACKAFVKAFLLHSYQQMREQASGGVQPNLNLQIVKSMPLPLPPLAEQAEIAQELAGCMAEVEQLRSAVALSLQQSTAQRQNILRAAFSGQLVPQNAADEPASTLLARIRAERTAQGAARKPRGRKEKEIS